MSVLNLVKLSSELSQTVKTRISGSVEKGGSRFEF